MAAKYSAAYPGGTTENCREVPGFGHVCPSRRAQLSTDFDIDLDQLGDVGRARPNPQRSRWCVVCCPLGYPAAPDCFAAQSRAPVIFVNFPDPACVPKSHLQIERGWARSGKAASTQLPSSSGSHRKIARLLRAQLRHSQAARTKCPLP